MTNKRGRALLTAAGTLIAAKMLMTTFAAAAEAPKTDGAVRTFLGVPFVTLTEKTIKQDGVEQRVAQRAAVTEAMKKMKVRPNHLTENAMQKIQEGKLFKDGWAIPPQLAKVDVNTPEDAYGTNTSNDGFANAFRSGTPNSEGGIIGVPTLGLFQKQIQEWFKKYAPAAKIPKIDPRDEHEILMGHEKGHIAGANEPQAEQIGVILFLKNNPDKRHVVKALRDRSQLQAFSRASNQAYSYHYGQAVVDAMDEVLSWPQSKINAFTDANIRELLEKGTFNMPATQIAEYNYKAVIMLKGIGSILGERDATFRNTAKGIPDTSSPTMQDLPGALADIREWAQKVGIDMKLFDKLQDSVKSLYKGDYQAPAVAAVTAYGQHNITIPLGRGLY